LLESVAQPVSLGDEVNLTVFVKQVFVWLPIDDCLVVDELTATCDLVLFLWQVFFVILKVIATIFQFDELNIYCDKL